MANYTQAQANEAREKVYERIMELFGGERITTGVAIRVAELDADIEIKVVVKKEGIDLETERELMQEKADREAEKEAKRLEKEAEKAKKEAEKAAKEAEKAAKKENK